MQSGQCFLLYSIKYDLSMKDASERVFGPGTGNHWNGSKALTGEFYCNKPEKRRSCYVPKKNAGPFPDRRSVIIYALQCETDI